MNALAIEAERIVKEAAAPLPGDTVKAQMNRAAEALGYPRGHWRIRAAWYGEAGSWSARALRDLENCYAAWKARRERERQHATYIAQQETAECRKRLEVLKAALLLADPDFYGADAHALGRAIDALGGADRSVDGPEPRE